MDAGSQPVPAAAPPGLLGTGGVGRFSRRRRPSGRPPPLPRPLQMTGIGWLIGFIVAVASSLLIFTGELRGPAVAVTVVDDAVVRWLAELNGPGLSAAMKVLAAPGSWPAITLLLWGLLLALIIFRRLRHLLVVVAAWTLQGLFVQYLLGPILRRPRPFGVVFRTDWYAWALPSEPMAALAVTLVGILYALVPEGRWRQRGKWTAAVVVALVAAARMHLGRGGAHRRGRGCRHRSDVGVARLSLVRPERGFPGDLPAGAGRPPGHRWGTRRSDPPGTGRPTRVGRRRRRTVRHGRVGRVDAATHQGRRRSGSVAVRQALRQQPSACRPLVQARPRAAVWPLGGRATLPHGAQARATRGLRIAQAAPRRPTDTAALRLRRAHPRAGVPAGHRVLRSGDRTRRRRHRRASRR